MHSFAFRYAIFYIVNSESAALVVKTINAFGFIRAPECFGDYIVLPIADPAHTLCADVTLFFFAKRFFGALTIRNVSGDSKHSNQSAINIVYRRL